MLYDLKIILKKSKPVLWYELEVPGGVTFSTLSEWLDDCTGNRCIQATPCPGWQWPRWKAGQLRDRMKSKTNATIARIGSDDH